MPDNFLSQNQSLKQEQTLSPRQMQCLELLHAPQLELQELIQQELTTNPMLELTDAPENEIPLTDLLRHEERSGTPDDAAGDGNDAEISCDDWHDELPLPDYAPEGNDINSGMSSEAHDYVIDSLSGETTLEQMLLDELAVCDCPPRQRLLAELIIGSLDERGYLITPLADIAMMPPDGADMAEAEAALRLVQSFDPPGVGARSLAECLLLQLNRSGNGDPMLRTIISEHLEDIGRNKLPQLSRNLKITLEELDKYIEQIRKLNPAPGSSCTGANATYIIPELTVAPDEKGNFYIIPGKQRNNLRIPERYFTMLDDPGLSANDRKYIREKILAAQEFLRALRQRESTIHRIGGVIAAEQHDFLASGVEELKPMTMRYLADKLELHETTVSRAVAGKYIATPQGIFPLRYFFSSGYTSDGGDALSSRAVQEKIRQIIEKENPQKPLSDETISRQLADDGLTVARRTVAKYRDLAGIPGASMRKKHL